MEGPVLAIVGSRNFTDRKLFESTIKDFILEHGRPKRIVSGGAPGADRMGEDWGHRNHLPVTSYRPQWKDPKTGKVDRGAGLKRNSDIVRECTHMIAFPSKKGRGTQDSILKAEAAGKMVIVVWID